MKKLIELIKDYEDSIINEESNKIAMNKYLRVERHMSKYDLNNRDLLKALEEVGAISPMSILNDWYEDLEYRMVVK
jgi:hypothetical protein